MRSLSASELVEFWEYGLYRHSVQRALTLLACCSDESRDDLAAISIGRRDVRLLEVYERLFGLTVQAFAECPACSEHLEYSIEVSDLMGSGDAAPQADMTLRANNFSLHLRLPDSVDLEEAGCLADVSAARRFLLERCICEASRDGSSVSSAEVPDSLEAEIEARIAQADPQTELLIDLRCGTCNHFWQVLFDVERFLWVKISALAKRLLREVHTLARAYGWSESDILSLSAQRRQAYLELAGA